MKKRSFLFGAFVGGVVSGVSALLFAPHSGKKTRSKLKYKGEELVDDVKFEVEKACRKGNKMVIKASENAKDKAKKVLKK